jgi:hypothetical protein
MMAAQLYFQLYVSDVQIFPVSKAFIFLLSSSDFFSWILELIEILKYSLK